MSLDDKSKNEKVNTAGGLGSHGMTRKDFLKGSALTIFGAALSDNVVAQTATEKEPTANGTPSTGRGSNRPYNTYDADVVVIGGGIAGMSAARAAMKSGAQVILVDKGPAGHSGASGQAWGHGFETTEWTKVSPKESMQAFLVDCAGMCDQDLFYNVCKVAHDTRPVAFGEQAGTIFQRGDDGIMVNENTKAGDKAPITMPYEYRHRRVAQLMIRAGLKVIDNTMALDIIRAKDGHVAGVVAIDLQNGDAYLFRCKQVIMATGGYTWQAGSSTNGPDSTGEGHAIFIRHGSPMKDMEFFQPDFDPVSPYSLRVKEKDQIWLASSMFVNGDTWWYAHNKNHVQYSKGFFNDPGLDAYPMAAFQGVVTTAVVEILHGGGTKGDGRGNGLLYQVDELYKQHNINTTAEGQVTQEVSSLLGHPYPKYVEVMTEFLGSCGTPKVDPATCETDIPGVYCAMHNISEIAAIGAWATGYMSGEAAAKKSSEMALPTFSEGDVQQILNHAYGLLEATPDRPIRATDIQHNIKRQFYKGMHLIRNGKDMQTALDEFLRIQKEDLPRVNVPVKSRQYNRDWRNAMELDSMLLCSIATSYASLYRKETRPFHYRTDYPEMDNKNWLVNVWVQRNSNGHWEVSKTPVNASMYSPEEIDKMLVSVDLRKPNRGM